MIVQYICRLCQSDWENGTALLSVPGFQAILPKPVLAGRVCYN